MEINKQTWTAGTISLALGLLPQGAEAQQQQKQPNIIFLLADDLGYGDIGVNGQELIRTPYINQLAANGKNFTRFYAGCTVSAPSRSSLFTGQHTGNTYIRGNKSVQPEGQEPLAAGILTLSEILKSAGYQTGAFGKWGLGPVGSTGDPNSRGFDRFYGFNCQGLAHRYYPTHLWDNDRKIILEENGEFLYQETFAPDLIQQEALSFIETADPEKPFFLYLPYTIPHAELLVPDDSIFQSYKGTFPENIYLGNDYGAEATPGGYASQEYPHAAFAALVTRVDLYVGQILQKLKEKGIEENTLFIFTSDNGPHMEGGADPDFFNSRGGLRGVKRDLYEGGVRVPFIAFWPGGIEAGTQSELQAAFWDILPTFAQLAGTETPREVDGISIVPELTGGKNQQKHPYLYWEFHERGGSQAILKDNWKLIRLHVDDPVLTQTELYDLSKDPAETTNLAGKYPQQVMDLSKLLEQAHTRSDLFPFAWER